VVTSQASQFRSKILVVAACVVALAGLTAACGGEEATDSPSTTLPVAQTDPPLGVTSTTGPPTTTAPTEAPGEEEPSDQATDALSDDNDWSSPEEELAAMAAALETGIAVDNPAGGVDAYLGGAPDVYTATAIKRGLAEAGVDLTGITLSVLPIGGTDQSLLVLEVEDTYLELGLPSAAEGADITGALLGLPEIDSAAITLLATLYRGTDEEGAFTLTFAVPLAALAEAHATGGDVGDSLLVQVERQP
jgi:hypothetical protein